MLKELMKKNGMIVSKLASEFLFLKNGDKINTVENYSAKYGCGRGTVQSALDLIKKYEAINLVPRGKLGTFIDNIDYVKLTKLSGIDSLVGIMPLPYSKRYEGLATGIYLNVREKQMPLNFAFMRGSNSRLESLISNRCDFIIVSRLTAEHYLKEGKKIKIIKAFGEKSYVNEHVVLINKNFKGEKSKKIRVGIDRTSIDLKILTEKYFNDPNKEIEYIELNYNNFLTSIENDIIDAAIWNKDDLKENSNVIIMKIDENKLNIRDTEAVIITKDESTLIKNLLNNLIDEQEVISIQEKVLLNKCIPRY